MEVNGSDLHEVAAFARQSLAETIRLHHATHYRVYMLDSARDFRTWEWSRHLLPCRACPPRTVVPPGSVGIAESQTGIYPTATPGGWRIIGRTPVSLYRPQSSSPFLFSPGDRVQFYPIDADEFTRISNAAPT